VFFVCLSSIGPVLAAIGTCACVLLQVGEQLFHLSLFELLFLLCVLELTAANSGVLVCASVTKSIS